MDDTDNFNFLSIDDLNDDCLIHIFTFLRVPDRCRIERVCKRWKSLAQVSWRRIKMLTLDNDFHLNDEDVTNANVDNDFHLQEYLNDEDVMNANVDDDFHLQEHINDEDVTNANVEVLHKVLRLCGPYLCRIVFDHDCIKLSESTISNIHTLCPNVEEIKLVTISKQTTLISVMSHFTNLKSFEVEFLEDSHDLVLSNFFDNNQKLISLTIEFCDFSTDCFSHLNHEAIEYFNFRHNSKDLNEYLGNVIRKFKNLRSLAYEGDWDDLLDLNLINTILKSVRSDLLKSLTLCLRMDEMNRDQLNFASHFQNLEELIIEGFNLTINDETLKSIVISCSKLRKLQIRFADITDTGFTWVTNLLPIESLFLSGTHITDKVLSGMKKLKYLFCSSCLYIKIEGLMALIETSQNIRKIKLIKCSDVHLENLIYSIEKSQRDVLEVETFHTCYHSRTSKSCSSRKVGKKMSIKIESICDVNGCGRIGDNGCFCNKQEYMYYIA